MKLRATTLFLILALGLVAAPLPAEAQQPGKVYRIGYLSTSTPALASYLLTAFRQGLRELGYVEGRNIIIESRWAEGKYERLPALIAEFVRLDVDVLWTISTPAALAAKKATTTIPITMIVNDPVASGLVASLARPGGNISGLSLVAPEVTGELLELLTETVPDASRVAVLVNPADSFTPLVVREAEIAARVLRVQLQIVEAQSPDEFDSAFATMTRERADALLVVTSSLFFTHRKQLADLAAKHHLPAMYGLQVHADAGGLMAYSPNLTHVVRRSATFVDKILKGANPGDLPVEQPTVFDLVINMKTAKALGITFPDSILIRADRGIE